MELNHVWGRTSPMVTDGAKQIVIVNGTSSSKISDADWNVSDEHNLGSGVAVLIATQRALWQRMRFSVNGQLRWERFLTANCGAGGHGRALGMNDQVLSDSNSYRVHRSIKLNRMNTFR
jgi:hypothetical protein